MKLVRFTAGILSSVTMMMAPIGEAKAKENQRRELVAQYLKNTGLSTNNKLTVGELWLSVRHVYPQNMRYSIDRWVSLNRDKKMPSIQVTNFKDSRDVEQVRLLFTHEGQSVTVTYTGNEDYPLKINGVAFSKNEVNGRDLNKIAARLIKEDSSVRKAYQKGNLPSLRKTNLVMSPKEFKHLKPRQRAEYLMRLRMSAEAASKVFEKRRGKQALEEFNSKYQWAKTFLFGEEAFAQSDLSGKTCIVAGYVSKYGENGSCGGENLGLADLRSKTQGLEALDAACAGDSTPCNPMVYGFTGSGKAHCVARPSIKYATAECNKMSPLDSDADKKRIIESYLKVQQKKNINLEIKDGAVSEEQLKEVSAYLAGLNEFILEAANHCEARGEQREDQDSACIELLNRGMELQAFSGGAVTPPITDDGSLGGGVGELPGGDQSRGDCQSQKPGSVLSGDGKACLCPDGTEDGKTNGVLSCIAIGSSSKIKSKSACGFWCRNSGWIIGGAVGIAAFGALWWMTKPSKAKGRTVDPTPPAGPGQAICISPMTLVDGVCQAPASDPVDVVPPPFVPDETGTGVETGGGSNGVR